VDKKHRSLYVLISYGMILGDFCTLLDSSELHTLAQVSVTAVCQPCVCRSRGSTS
jgi:hypothetical protein